MSLKTRFSNLANILDTGQAQDGVLVLESPVLDGADWARLKAHFGSAAAQIDCTFASGGDPETLRAAIQRIRNRSRAGGARGQVRAVPVRPRDRRRRVGIAGVLAAAAVHTHLVRRGLALLLLDQHRDRRMPRHALLCGADRGRRDDRLRVPRRSRDRRPSGARAVWRTEPRQVPRQSPQGDRRGAAQDHVEDGDRGDLQLSWRV